MAKFHLLASCWALATNLGPEMPAGVRGGLASALDVPGVSCVRFGPAVSHLGDWILLDEAGAEAGRPQSTAVYFLDV